MADAWGSFTNPSVTQPSATGGGSPGGGSPGGSTPSWGGAGGNTPAPGGAPGGGQPGGANPGTFGQAAYPWDMPYQGQFTAPMSPYENNALQGYNQFVQGGQGLNNAGNYLNNELSGQYLNLNSNPYLQQIQQGEQGMKNYNDQQAMGRIGSSMAVGGNALSGARLGAQNDYMNQSNNQFEALMGNLMNQNYQGERGLMNQAPGQLANLANTAGSGYAQLFGMGALPRSLQQNDLNAQYNDFQRQTGNMQNSYNQPQNQILQMLYGGGYHGQYQPTYGSSTLDQIAGLLGGSGGLSSILGGLGNLGSLFGGSGTTPDYSTPGSANDGIQMGYDAAPGTSGPANYYDKNWYNNALTAAEANRAQQTAAAKNGPNTTVPAILTLLMSLLGQSGQSNKSKAGLGIGGVGPGGTSPGSHPTTQQQGITANSPGSYNPNSPFANPYGDLTNAPGNDMYGNQPIGPGLPDMPGSIPIGQSLPDYLGYIPSVDNGLNNLAGGYGNSLDVGAVTDSGGGGGGDFGA